MAEEVRSPSGETLERLHAVEEDIRKLTHSVTELTAAVSAQSANVKTVMEQMGTVFTRINQPTNWAVVIAAMVLLITGADLKVSPIEDALARVRASDSKLETRMFDFEIESAERHGYEKGKRESMEMMLRRLARDYYSQRLAEPHAPPPKGND